MKTQYINGDKSLFDDLVCGDLTPSEFKNNSKIIEEFSKTIDTISKMETGYCLLTIDIKNKRHIQLIVLQPEMYNKYKIYSTFKTTPMENPMSYKVHEINEETDFMTILKDIKTKLPYGINESTIVDMMITDTLDGYKLNTNKLNPVIELNKGLFNKTYSTKQELKDNGFEDILDLHNNIQNIITNEKMKVTDKLTKYINSLKCEELKYSIALNNILTAEEYSNHTRSPYCNICVIDDVQQLDNMRYFKYTSYTFNSTRTKELSCDVERDTTYRIINGSGSRVHNLQNENTHYYTNSSSYNTNWGINGLPYNFIDKGRTLIALGNNTNLRYLAVSNDPRIDENYIESLLTGLRNMISKKIKEKIGCNNITIPIEFKNKNEKRVMSLNNITRSNDVELQKFMQSLKILTDEYKYVIKREKSQGSNVKITDNIIYDHLNSKIIYNDFNIKIDDEQIKNDIYTRASGQALKFYRNEVTEETIINNITSDIFTMLKLRVEGWGATGFPINLTLNDAVNISIDRRGSNNFTYINNQRFNKIEVIPIIKEMTCYRDQETADKFLKNIGKLGLSVYIGITTGYELHNRIYRFKKNKGRSKYTLVIDDVEIELKGKTILNELYAVSTGKSWKNISGIDDKIFKATLTGYDYVKYKFLIDSSYKVFLEKSKNFLNSKIEEIGGTRVKYYDRTRRKILEGIHVTGQSGKNYIVAYNSKESFVFMDPSLDKSDEDIKEYSGGTYICMIDQSSIKSNIGYDTVISKIMSLKNDSVISSKIYNLEDELNK